MCQKKVHMQWPDYIKLHPLKLLDQLQGGRVNILGKQSTHSQQAWWDTIMARALLGCHGTIFHVPVEKAVKQDGKYVNIEDTEQHILNKSVTHQPYRRFEPVSRTVGEAAGGETRPDLDRAEAPSVQHGHKPHFNTHTEPAVFKCRRTENIFGITALLFIGAQQKRFSESSLSAVFFNSCALSSDRNHSTFTPRLELKVTVDDIDRMPRLWKDSCICFWLNEKTKNMQFVLLTDNECDMGVLKIV
ncbi:hypothetical protein CBL_00965 [Carabus blaptoides fortunei]